MTELICALDYPNAAEALKLVEQLKGLPITYKIGFESFIAEGPSIVKKVQAAGADVFLDLKLHDIPNTVQKAVQSALALDVKYLTLHLAGEREMLMRSQETVEKMGARTTLLGVTVLTSMSGVLWKDLGERIAGQGSPDIERSVLVFAELAQATGIPGLICSPHEIPSLKNKFPKLKLVTPGIRMQATADDQTRTMTAFEAAKAGAHAIVVGRPITQASDPREAVQAIQADLERATR